MIPGQCEKMALKNSLTYKRRLSFSFMLVTCGDKTKAMTPQTHQHKIKTRTFSDASRFLILFFFSSEKQDLTSPFKREKGNRNTKVFNFKKEKKPMLNDIFILLYFPFQISFSCLLSRMSVLR